MHGRDRVGPDARARRRADARDRRGALRRARHRHRQFMYENTGPARARDGRRADRGRRRRPRDLPPPLRGHPVRQARAARARASASVQRFDDGALTLTPPHARRLRRHRRRGELLRGRHRPPALASRAPRSRRSCATGSPTATARRARSRCAPPTTASTSRRIARAHGGGGHRHAAGFSTELGSTSSSRLPARARSGASSERGARRGGGRRDRRRPARRQAGGGDLARRRRAGGAGALPARAVKVGPRRHARPVRDRAAARARRPRDARRSASSWRCRRPTRPSPGWGGPRRRATPRARSRRARMPPEPLVLPDGAAAPAPARLLRREGRRRARVRGARGAGSRSSSPSARSRSAASRQLWRDGDRAGFAIECSSGTYVRSLSPTSATRTATSCGARAIGPFAVDDADPERLARARRRARVPARRCGSTGDDARRAGHGVAVERRRDRRAPATRRPLVRLLDDDGLIAARRAPG